MSEVYEKFYLDFSKVEEDGIYMKTKEAKVSGYIESYKDKRGVYLKFENLVPSSVLATNKMGEYALLLLGKEGEALFSKEFDNFYIGRGGERKFYERFKGPKLENLSSLLLLIKKGDEVKTICHSDLPFVLPKENKGTAWEKAFSALEGAEFRDVFSGKADETGAKWKVLDFHPCKYGHIILGENEEGERFVGVPGRFLKEERPKIGETALSLWQPIREGEEFYTSLEEMTDEQAMHIYGYWIGRIGDKGAEII